MFPVHPKQLQRVKPVPDLINAVVGVLLPPLLAPCPPVQGLEFVALLRGKRDESIVQPAQFRPEWFLEQWWNAKVARLARVLLGAASSWLGRL